MIARSRHRHLSAGEDGFSLIELLIAIMLLSLAVFALVSTLDGSRALSNTGERQGAASSVAEQEMERALAKHNRYRRLALTVAPSCAAANNCATAGDAADKFVCAANVTGGPATYRWDQTACPTGAAPFGDELVIGDAGTDPPQIGTIVPSKPWTDARSGARGTVHTYVTWVDEDCPEAPRGSPGTPPAGCQGAELKKDFKRITVAVTVTNGPPRRPIVLSAIMRDPTALPTGNYPNPYGNPGAIF